MAKTPRKAKTPPVSATAPAPDEGLLKFYSSQAEAILAQYRRVEFLLGAKSHEHTHSGTLCEVLLRDYLRRTLLPWMGVDKGFIYGKSEDRALAECSPEIDLLIHDQQECRPIFRQDDFVIVQPEAVLGIIQVKKRLVTSGRNPLAEGLRNVMQAKRHLLNQLRRNRSAHQKMERACSRVVSAVVGFDGMTKAKTYWQHLRSVLGEHADFTDQFMWKIPGRFFVLPHFVGTLNGFYCLRRAYDEKSVRFECYKAMHSGHNVCIQVFVDVIANLLHGGLGETQPPFQYPLSLQSVDGCTLS